MTEELQAQNRLQEQFLSIASHELRSPIHPILNYASFALEGHMPYEEAVKKIFEQALRLQQLASDILDVTRIEAGQLDCHFEKTQIDEVILAAVDFVKPGLNDGVSLEVSPLPNVEVDMDRSRVMQVLTNLLDNSVKFTKRGKIGVEASAIDNKLQIKVSDTGEGIPKEILPRLFEKFASKSVAGGTQHGTGLGLFISRAIVRAHNGEISAHNNKDGGSTFIIILPIVQNVRD
jgi:signal transduction histidine kinase